VGKFPSRNENAARVEWGVSSDHDSRPLRSIRASLVSTPAAGCKERYVTPAEDRWWRVPSIL
jgi:hypothetical protein